MSYAAPTYAAFGHQVGILTSAAAKGEPLLAAVCKGIGELVALPSEQSLTYTKMCIARVEGNNS